MNWLSPEIVIVAVLAAFVLGEYVGFQSGFTRGWKLCEGHAAEILTRLRSPDV